MALSYRTRHRLFCVAVALLIVAAKSLSASEVETMTTSYYGDEVRPYIINGKEVYLMANGDEFDWNDPTIVAHKKLPFGTKLRLTNPNNDVSIVVEVQDRGPYVPNRELDVSIGAARKLGILKQGVAQLEVQVLHIPGNV